MTHQPNEKINFFPPFKNTFPFIESVSPPNFRFCFVKRKVKFAGVVTNIS